MFERDYVNEIYCLNKDLKIRKDHKTSMLFNPKTEFFYELNETSGFVLGLCDGKNSTNDIIKKVKKKFEGDDKTIELDTIDILEKFADAKIIIKKA